MGDVTVELGNFPASSVAFIPGPVRHGIDLDYQAKENV